MEKGKGTAGRGSKSKTPLFPTDLIALGKSSRGSASDSSEGKRSSGKAGSSHAAAAASGSAGGGVDRKREGPPLASSAPAKKSKSSVAPASAGAAPRTGMAGGPEIWEIVAVECEPVDLVPLVLEAYGQDEADRYVGLICGAIRTLRSQRWKPDPLLFASLAYLCKLHPSLFTEHCVTLALNSLLRRDAQHNFKSKGNPAVPVMAASLLMQAYSNKKHWPGDFIELYVEDALNERMWVDNEYCAGFVNNILTAVNTRVPPKSLLDSLSTGTVLGRSSPNGSGQGSPVLLNTQGSSMLLNTQGSPILLNTQGSPVLFGGTGSPMFGQPPGAGNQEAGSTPGGHEAVDGPGADKGEEVEVTVIPVRPRYSGQSEMVESIVLQSVREQLNKRQPPENITRNFLRLLAATCGLVEVRVLAAPRLELWLQNLKLNRPAQELLMAVCVNCTTYNARDNEVIIQLVKIRLKTKALVQLYLTGIRELISANVANLETVMKHTVYNELSSTARNPNNMAMVAAMFQSNPESSATLLAEIFMELLMNREDYLRPLRALLREISRVVRHDMNLPAFCRGLMADRSDIQAFKDFEFKERMFSSIVDIISLCIFVSISPAVKEAASLASRGDKRDIQVVQNYQMQCATIQRDTVWWLQEIAPAMYAPSAHEFVLALYKALFQGSPEQYYKTDNWPAESDRAVMLRFASEVPLLENTLLRILTISLNPKCDERKMSPNDALELVDQLVKRSALHPHEGVSMIQVENLEVVNLLFNLSTYHHPETINLPPDFCPPQMAIAPLYWKSWMILVVLSAHNPGSLGLAGWDNYPTLRMMMEMCIMNHFAYPTPTMVDDDEWRAKEAQLAQREKSQILEYESLLAAASNKTITEHSSLLLATLITMDPKGQPRKPPQAVLDQLQALNSSHSIGALLCSCRQPDFLQDIIQQPGVSNSKPWMADLVNRSEVELSNFPIQCLCECLLMSTELVIHKQSKLDQLLTHLQQLLADPGPEQQHTVCEVLRYILHRLSSNHTASRQQAIEALKMILSAVPDQEEPRDATVENRWLLRQLPQLPHFQAVRGHVVLALRQACQVENDVSLVTSYLTFLAIHTAHDGIAELTELVQDLAQLIVERSSICAALLPSSDRDNASALKTQHALMVMLYAYLQKARSPQREAYPWSESMDQILITWPNREETTMHILVVHALVILLNYGPGLDVGLFDSLLEIWFPPPGQEPPKAYLVDTSEEALLLPDWLKLRMIRSNVDRLVDAALMDLEPSSLLLFIQSFGIPVKSMNKLLAKLDEAVEQNPAAVGEAVLDKTYMAQLVQVQHHRGAVGGHVLVQVLKLEYPSFAEASVFGKHRGRPAVTAVRRSVHRQQKHKKQVRLCKRYLHMLFGINQSYFSEELKLLALLSLQKILSTEMETPESLRDPVLVRPTIIRFLSLQLSNSTFTRSILENVQFSCPLFRLLTKVHKDLLPMVENIMDYLQGVTSSKSRSPLMALIKQHMSRSKRLKPIKRLCVLPNSGARLERCRLNKVERAGQQLIRVATVTGSRQGDGGRAVQDLVEAFTRLLMQNLKAGPRHHNRCTGLLLDWLEEMEPELIGATPDVQMQLLFSQLTEQISNQSCRPYLLTLLTHNASWLTLGGVMEALLCSGGERYESTPSLDFLSALTSNPRLWQGREKKTPKNYESEEIFRLRTFHASKLIRMILYEAQSLVAAGCCSEANERMYSRLPLMCQSLGNLPRRTQSIAEKVSCLIDGGGKYSKVCHSLLLQMYLLNPGIIFHIPHPLQEDALVGISVAAGSSSVLDRISHTLFTGMMETPHTKDWVRRGQEYELALRKLASVHPVLTLRQLPMVTAALRGRVQMDWVVLRSRHHLSLLHQVLGVMQLMQPYVFRQEYAEPVFETLNTYFALFDRHMVSERGLQQLKKDSGQKESYALLNQFLELVNNFISFDAARALKYLQGYGQLLHNIQRLHPSVLSVRQLLTTIALPATDQQGKVCFAMPPASLTEPSQQWTAMLVTLSKMQGDEVLTVLQELEQLSVRKASVLDSFVDRLCEMLLSPNKELRTLSHTLLARHLKHNPTNNQVGVTAFFRCLESDQPDVVVSALNSLPEMVLVAQEHGLSLMQRVFKLGVSSFVNVAPCISKTNALLNMQKGC